MKSPEHFGSRLGMMLAMLGMAVGTGNIWRFPRIVARNGGGEFLIAWVVFLFLWSIPLILLEFGMGRKTRSGPIRAFTQMMGPRWAWLGAFSVFVTAAIMFYYSVVAGWTVRFTLASLLGELPESTPGAFWQEFTSSYWPVATHGIMLALASIVVARGIKWIERVALILMPTLFLLIGILTIRALMLPGASDGVAYLFSVDWENLTQARLWIEALTQNAWDTGAGWGLVLCYAAYLREREDTALNAFILPTVNNMVSLCAGIMVLCTVFSVVPAVVADVARNPERLDAFPELAEAVARGEELNDSLIQETIFNAGNEGLTFIWMPQLFAKLPFGQFLMVLFFLALSFAAFTSLVALVEVATRALVDAGVPRVRAVTIVGTTGFFLGLPSAISLLVLHNQDWVWGVALMLSGLFFAVAVIRNGISRFREQQLNHSDSDIRIGRWWDMVIGLLVPAQAIFLLVWFLVQEKLANPEGWLRPFDRNNATNVGTVLTQFGVVFAVLILCNKWIAKASVLPELSSPSGQRRKSG